MKRSFKFRIKEVEGCTAYVVKTMEFFSCAITVQQVCTFIFAHSKTGLIMMWLICLIINERRVLKTKWLDNIKQLLCSNGYDNIWESQTNFNVHWLSRSFKQKLKDTYLQNWNSLVVKSSSGKNYRIFKHKFEMNKYFTYLPFKQCRVLTAFRTRNHRLPIEVGRWSSIPIDERKCILCNDGVGDEFHYILECKHFNEQRRKHINAHYIHNPNILKFHSLMSDSSRNSMFRLCHFIELILRKIKDNTH